MKRFLIVLCAVAVVGLASAAAQASIWQTFVIRGATDGDHDGQLPTITPGAGSVVNFGIPYAGQKAGWGTDALDGTKLGDFVSASIYRADGSVPEYAPYANFWITDGTQFAVVAAAPAVYPTGGTAGTVSFSWNAMKTLDAPTWIYENASVDAGAAGKTLADYANWTIRAPSALQLTTGWGGLTSGAPDELLTNAAYGFTWMFGDTGANYSGPGYIVSDPAVTSNVPEPATILVWSLLGVVAVGYGAWRRRRAG